MAGDPQEPISELAPGGVEAVDLLDGKQPDLLVDVLGDGVIPSHQVIDQPEDGAGMAVIHGRPGGPVASSQRPVEARFIVHRRAASSGGVRVLHQSIAMSRPNPSPRAGVRQMAPGGRSLRIFSHDPIADFYEA
jgi:hypothetical protein